MSPFEAGRWWERFGDENLNALMDESFDGNLDLAQGYERLAQAEATAGIIGAARWPTLAAAASGGRVRSRGFTGVAGFSGFAASESYTLSASASYEIDLWRRLSSRTKGARLDALAAHGDLEAIYISLSAELADLFYLAVEQRAQLELTDSTIEAFRETLERVERRYRAGLVTALDVYQSRENLASARARRPEFASNLERTEHAISVLLGRAPERGIGGKDASLPDPPEFSAGLPSELLTRRPDITAALHRLEASDKRVAAAVADRFPSFNLLGDYGGASADIGRILDSPNIFWNLLVQAAMPIVDGGRRRAEVRRTEAALRESLAAYKKTVLISFREVEDDLSAGRASTERIKMLEVRVAASDAALKLSLDQYMQGLSDYLPVLTEQQGLFDAESALLNAKRRLISERIGLARALGGGWPETMIKGRLAELSGKD
jgi:NodT family efflux transporter outer membrane factor (OMF) lipoprotein